MKQIPELESSGFLRFLSLNLVVFCDMMLKGQNSDGHRREENVYISQVSGSVDGLRNATK